MAYDKQIYTQILREYDLLQNNHYKELEQKKAEVYKKIPRIKEIDTELSTIGLNLTRKILNKTADTEEIIKNIRQKTMELNMEKTELLKTNGFPVDYLSIHYKCDKCKDTGYVNNTMCKCFEQKLIKEAYA